jgi:hypothetical protein
MNNEISPSTLLISDLNVMYLNFSIPKKYHSQAKAFTTRNDTEKSTSLMS